MAAAADNIIRFFPGDEATAETLEAAVRRNAEFSRLPREFVRQAFHAVEAIRPVNAVNGSPALSWSYTMERPGHQSVHVTMDR